MALQYNIGWNKPKTFQTFLQFPKTKSKSNRDVYLTKNILRIKIKAYELKYEGGKGVERQTDKRP
jgi:hypothetical protein